MLNPSNFKDIKHAYDLYVGIRNKPDVEYLVGLGNTFLQPFYTNYSGGDLLWNTDRLTWMVV
jgi:hypothetical protein